MITEDKLFQVFIATLKLSDVNYIDTRLDRHHAQFDQALTVLRAAQERNDRAVARFPRTLVASPFTGRFAALDQALLQAQETGISGSQNPFYSGADLPITKRHAQRTLEQLTDEERALVKQMVDAFQNEPASSLLGVGGPSVAE